MSPATCSFHTSSISRMLGCSHFTALFVDCRDCYQAGTKLADDILEINHVAIKLSVKFSLRVQLTAMSVLVKLIVWCLQATNYNLNPCSVRSKAIYTMLPGLSELKCDNRQLYLKHLFPGKPVLCHLDRKCRL